MIELDSITIHEGDGRMRAEGRRGELVQEIPPDVKTRLFLAFRFLSPMLPGCLPLNLRATITRSRLVVQLPRFLIAFGQLIRRPLFGKKNGRVGMFLLWVSSYFTLVTKIYRERLLLAHHLPSTSESATHRPKRHPTTPLLEPEGVAPR